MRWCLVAGLAIAVSVAIASLASGQGDDVAASWEYVSADGPMSWAVVRAPLPAEQLGATAVRAADGEPAPALLGVDLSPPAGFPDQAFGDPGRAPFAAIDSGVDRRGHCDCNTTVGDESRERIAALYVTTTFRVGDELGDLDVLSLSARYSDGLVAYINGREVARRSIGAGERGVDVAWRVRGPEVEVFTIPVVAGLLRRGENRLSIVVKPSAERLAPRLSASLVGRKGKRIVRGPIVQRVGPTSATIVFDTDLPTRGAVEVGDGQQARRVESAGGGLAVHHRVDLTDLKPSAPVHYRVIAGQEASEPLTFHTAPSLAEPIRFAVYGDMRGGHKTHKTIVDAILADAPDFVIVTGDLVLRGTDEADWQRYFTVASELLARVPCYPVAGNHDLGTAGDELRRMSEIFAPWPGPADRPSWASWHSFDVADLHFVMLDSNAYQEKRQLDWLDRDLAAARKAGARAIFAVVHDGPYSRGVHGGNAYAVENYVPILTKYGVTMIFSGHDHLYQRGKVKGLSYIVSGGGGAPLYPVRCGIKGKKRCTVNDGMEHVASEHHYVLVTVTRSAVTVCPKRPDRTALEICVRYRLRGLNRPRDSA
jgi:3',5'-cyclic AMP phosphodiesterase CpdA